jgi:dimethylamine--corrinoid protein Co-methyltransferase
MAMASTHAIASGMGGIRTAGDLVARMQMSRAMKNKEAKAYVADKLGVTVPDLTDPIVMNEVREDLGLGRLSTVLYPNNATAIEAKFRIAELLDIEINCVNRFRDRIR